MNSINPYTGILIKKHDVLSDKALVEKIEKADSASKLFRETNFSQRSLLLKKAAEILIRKSFDYAEIITNEMGKPISESLAEIKKCAWVCEYYAENAEEFLKDKVIKSDAQISYVKYQSMGSILAVMPWNFPFWQLFRFAAPALMAGNTVLLKHASNVQISANTIQDIFDEAGFEAGVFQNLAIKSHKVKSVLDHPAVKAVTLTGSEAAGSAVAEIAGKNIKKSVLELGGNNAFVVLKGADINQAVETALLARLLNGGQSCIAAKRFILENEIHDQFIDLLIKRMGAYMPGDPLNVDTKMGPLASEYQAKDVHFQMMKSIEMGAKLIYGGKQEGAIFEPSILKNVSPGMPAFDEELFGPVFAITTAYSYEEALELANKSDFGLGINVFTKSKEKAEYFITNAEEGAVFINSMVKSDPRLPFGGVKKSGFGRELSVEGIKEFVNIKTVYIENL